VRKVSLLVGVLTLALTACHPFESLDDPFAGVDLNTDTQGANEDIAVDITPPDLTPDLTEDFDAETGELPASLLIDAQPDSSLPPGRSVTLSVLILEPKPEPVDFTVTWRQLSGPQDLTLSSTRELLVKVPPNTEPGSIFGFEATVCLPNGECATDTVFVTATPALETDLFVADFGDDETGDGTPSAPFRTFARAIPAIVREGHARIHVADGLYGETFQVDRRDLELLGSHDPYSWSYAPARRASKITGVVSTSVKPGELWMAGFKVHPNTTPDSLCGVLLQSVTVHLSECTFMAPSPEVNKESTSLCLQGSQAILEAITFGGSPTTRASSVSLSISLKSTVEATNIVVAPTSLTRRTHMGVLVDDSTLTLTDSSIQLPAAADALPPIGDPEGHLGLGAVNSAVLALVRTEVSVLGGATDVQGVLLDDASATISESTILAGATATVAGDGVRLHSIGIGSNNLLSVESSQISSGLVPYSGLVDTEGNISVGLLCEFCELELNRGAGPSSLVTIDAAGGDYGVALALNEPSHAELRQLSLNQAEPGCQGAGCFGLTIAGAASTDRNAPLMPTPHRSCCNPASFAVVLEDSDIRGGTEVLVYSAAVVVEASEVGGTEASACLNDVRLDGGVSADTSAGLSVAGAPNFMLQNSVVFAGNGVFNIALKTTNAAGVNIANNIIRAVGLEAEILSKGIILETSGSAEGASFYNNIIQGGWGPTSLAAAFSNDANLAPRAFFNNNLVGNGQGALQQLSVSLLNAATWAGDNDSVPGCLGAAPASAARFVLPNRSECLGTGLERNRCEFEGPQFCETPWLDQDGEARVDSQAFTTCAPNAPLTEGPGRNDVGPDQP